MRRKSALLIALIMVASVAFSYILLTRFVLPHFTTGSYEKSIVRSTHNTEEEKALYAAENSNYADIFSLKRFTQFGNSSGDWPYTWANFIDAGVIEYYDDRFENLKGTPKDIEFRYEANVYAWNQIRMVYVSPPENGSIYDDSIRVLSINGSLLFRNANYTGPAWGMRFAYRNDSEYREIQAGEIDFSFSKSYVVVMKLEYSEVWGSLAAFYADVYQIIIVDQDFVSILLCVQSAKGIS